MARKQAADSDAKRETIMLHAAELFAEKGFAGSSVSDLAERCAVSKSLIYQYYASKEDILFDVMNDHIDDLLSAVKSFSPSRAAPEDVFPEVTKALLQRYVGAAARQKVLLYELGSLPTRRRNEIIRKQREIIALMESFLAAANPSYKDEKDILRAKTMLFFGMLNWTHTWFKPDGPVSRDALAVLAADCML